MRDQAKIGDRNRARAKIVIVDPDGKTGEFIGSLLGEAAYEFHLAKSGREAAKLAEKLQPELALVEKDLPDCAGLDLLSELARLSPLTMSVMITAEPSHEFVIRTIKAGAACYLAKPFEEPKSIREKLEKALERQLREARWHKRLAETKAIAEEIKRDIEMIRSRQRNAVSQFSARSDEP